LAQKSGYGCGLKIIGKRTGTARCARRTLGGGLNKAKKTIAARCFFMRLQSACAFFHLLVFETGLQQRETNKPR
jgi:hypothetical protein